MKYIKFFEDYHKEKEIADVEEFDPFGHMSAPKTKAIDKSNLLTFGISNAKLKYPYFSIPSGYTCPFASMCKSLAHRKGGKFSDGKSIQDLGQFRCYAASTEVMYKNVRESRWKNFELLRKLSTKEEMSELIITSLQYLIKTKGDFSIFRIHESGDFYSQQYFDAWLDVAKAFPDIVFYAYTKSLPFWVARLNNIPKNLKLIASVGGSADHLVQKYNLRYCVVVDTVEEAKAMKLRIDLDETIAYGTNDNFALLLHGSQKAGTEKAKQTIKNANIIRSVKNKIGVKNESVAQEEYFNDLFGTYVADNEGSESIWTSEIGKTEADEDMDIQLTISTKDGIQKIFFYKTESDANHDLELSKKTLSFS